MPLLSVIVPILNELPNVPRVVERLEQALAAVDWEVVFVDDDSEDRSADVARAIAQQKPYVRVLQRIGRRGLGSACLEGMLATSSPYLAVMDGDLQHDESIVPEMLEMIQRDGLDIVVASRNVQGGSKGNFAAFRTRLSDFGAAISQRVCGCRIADPMSGFFLLSRDFLNSVLYRTSGVGFKILVDLLASSPVPVKIREVPYRFRERIYGSSKLDVNVCLEFLQLLAEKTVGHLVPVRFALFMLIGVAGLVLHLSVLAIMFAGHKMAFATAQSIATLIAIGSNFFLNNLFTFRDQRLRGFRMITGLISFYAACAFGVWINVDWAQSLLRSGLPWYLAGAAGLGVGAVWNYSVTSVITWRRSVRRQRVRTRQARKAAPSAVRDTSWNLPNK
jgi:dolichol-phosphate mannosyltransferase